MNVLGIHLGHDSSAALVTDGRIVADVAEERFTRTKHYCGLPMGAINYCLKSRQLTMAEIDAIAVPAEGSVPELNFLLDLKGRRQELKSRKGRMLEFARELFNSPGSKAPVYIK